MPAGAPTARFVGVAAYEAAGGPVLRDLFADEHENGVWLEDPKLLGSSPCRGSRRPRRARDPLEVGRGHGRGRLERDGALRAHPPRARQAHRCRDRRERAAVHPPRRDRHPRRARADRRAGRGGRDHQGAPRRDRGRGRGAGDLPRRGLRDGRVHRHHRAGTRRRDRRLARAAEARIRRRSDTPLFEIDCPARRPITLDRQVFTDQRRSAQKIQKFGAGARGFNCRHGREGLAYPPGVIAACAKNFGHGLYKPRVVRGHGDLNPAQSFRNGPYPAPNDPPFRSFMLGH